MAQQRSGDPNPMMQHADSLFRAQQWAEAARAFESLAAGDSSNGLLWFRLGASLEPQKKFGEAAKAYQHAAGLGFQPMMVDLRLARVYSQNQEPDRALDQLRNAAKMGFPAALVDSEPGLAAIRSRPEYAAIVASAEGNRFPCRAVHDFDFWAGTFDVGAWSQPTVPPSGVAVNTRSYEGCVFVEQFSSKRPGGGGGMSMSFYDVNRRTWRMVWNDDNNSSNDFEGTVQAGVMHFLGWVLDPAGKRVLASNTIERMAADTMRQTYAISPDSGKSWVTQQSGRWVRRVGGGS
ncbi:MAG: hypothetical protein ABJC74_13775 [Gemmatimonadota bacterium]